jgi:glycosyltransferase involved in cell wall biosynthesis
MRTSVVIAAWNAAWCIERAIDSVLGQTRAAHEIIVCDDGSTDGTPDRVERRYGSSVKVLRLPHRNASAARREGLEQATGDWLAFLDADDVWWPGKLERQAAWLARHPEVRWLGSDGRLISTQGVVRESWLSDYFDPVTDLVGDFSGLLLRRCFPLVSSMVVEADVYRSTGGLDPSIPLAYDYDLWLRLAARVPGAVLSERLVDYYTGPATLSKNFNARYRDDLELMRHAESGRYGGAPEFRRLAAERAAVLEFKLALIVMRQGGYVEARERLRRAARGGSWLQRALAAGGAMMPDLVLSRLARTEWAKSTVAASLPQPARLTVGEPS